jgi:hypothetical protein
MAKAISNGAHNFVECLWLNVESQAENLFLSDVGQLALWHWRSNSDQG